MQQSSVLLTSPSSFGRPEWVVTAISSGILFILTYFAFFAFFDWLPFYEGFQTGVPRKARFGQRLRGSFALTFWTFLVIISGWIYVDSVYSGSYDFFRKVLYLAVPIFISIATFALEGLEIAYTDLRDKDAQQFRKTPAYELYQEISTKIGETNFYEAREWAIIALLVGGTLLIEQPKYYVPYFAVISDPHHEALAFMRILLTTALTAFALVWVAQSPAKFLARKNSVEFLGYCRRAPVLLVRLVLLLLRGLGLSRPSNLINETMLNYLMTKCKNARRLLPSDRTFFADSLKKYGYGYLLSDDIVTVKPNGGLLIKTKALFYIGNQRRTIKRSFSYEKDYCEETLRDLVSAHPRNSSYAAFVVPLIGEKADQPSLETWEQMFYSPNIEVWNGRVRNN